MPYNNTTIPPPEEITGSTALPLARVKRILHIDEEINQCSANAAFAITVATEMFIRYLAEQALKVNKAEKKPRRNIQYKDLANAVARIDNLEFLSDVIPRTTTFKEYKDKKEKKAKLAESLPNGQTTLGQPRSLPRRPAGINGFEGGPAVDGSEFDEVDPRRKDNLRGVPLNYDGDGMGESHGRHIDSNEEERGDAEMLL